MSSIRYDEGDALRGVEIVCDCRKMKCNELKSILHHKTKKHRGSKVVLIGGVYCEITKTFKIK